MEDRFDFIFSYWLFAWWGLYALQVTRFSPKLWLLAGVLYEIGLFGILLIYHYPAPYNILFVAINLIIKGVPLWVMRNEPARGVWPGVVLFGVYLVWLNFNGTSLSELSARSWSQIQKRKPFSVGINQIVKRFSVLAA